MTNRLRLSMAMGDYEHVRDLAAGVVVAEGIQILPLDLPVEEIFYRFLHHREWDISEISMAKYSAMVSRGDTSLVGIPVFPSRAFRHSSMYVRADAGIKHPRALSGRRVGVPEWAQTASVYSRGLLVHEYGVALSEVDWYQAGVNQPGRTEKVQLGLPDGVSYTSVPDRSLSEMLLAGDVDAVLSAHPPDCFERGDGEVVRLFDDVASVEREYHAKTGIFPIMHTVVIRSEVVEENPWVPANLYTAFREAKRRSFSRVHDMTISRFPIPWLQDHLAGTGLDVADPWPYGVEENRTTLEAFLTYGHEQGVLAKPLRPEELFTSAIDAGYRI